MTAVAASERPAVAERSPWRAVAVPSEHGGWGLTLEPVLLGLLVAFSWSGLAIGLAAVAAFVVRTPLKLVAVDRRRHRALPRTRLAVKIATVELAVLGALAGAAAWSAGLSWLLPVLVASPLVAVEWWFDVRSRGRRLAPELAGAVGIAAVVAAIVIAGGGDWRLAGALWLVLAGRAVASIPFVRTQILRLRRGPGSFGSGARLRLDLFQLAGTATALTAIVLEPQVVLGAVAVTGGAIAQSVAVRRPHVPPAKTIGMRQMVGGLTVVIAAATGVLL